MKISLLLLTILFANILFAQSLALPDVRSTAHLIYHPKSKALLLMDGYKIHPDSNQNNVWKWNGKTWKQLPASGPSSRDLSAGALNTHNGNIVIFGGLGRGGYEKDKKGDCWSFDDSMWNEIKIHSIGTRDHHKMVYADHLSAFILYGGNDEERSSDTITWILKDNQFTALKLPGPGGRYHFGMAYDVNRKKVVLYGGGKAPLRKDLWEFDGKEWIKINTDAAPGARLRHSLIYADHLKMVVLHGGYEETNGWTWGWDGKQWKKIAEGGPKGDMQALGYDPIRKAIVAYGGNDENDLVTSRLWELEGGKWQKISDNGLWEWVDGKLQRKSN